MKTLDELRRSREARDEGSRLAEVAVTAFTGKYDPVEVLEETIRDLQRLVDGIKERRGDAT